MKKNFDNFIKNFKDKVFNLDFYVDYDKAIKNVDIYKKEIEVLNKAILAKEPLQILKSAFKENSNLQKLIPSLIAVRKNVIQTISESYDFSKKMDANKIIEFIDGVGLLKIIQNNRITNFNDYLLGLEVGMDTNARKNRTGKAMESLVSDLLIEKGLIFSEQVSLRNIANIIPDFDWEDLSSQFDKFNADKRVDFLFKYKEIYYLTEVNFYSSGGSKLNETTRSFIMLNNKLKKYEHIKFLWITDGIGWLTAKKTN